LHNKPVAIIVLGVLKCDCKESYYTFIAQYINVIFFRNYILFIYQILKKTIP